MFKTLLLCCGFTCLLVSPVQAMEDEVVVLPGVPAQLLQQAAAQQSPPAMPNPKDMKVWGRESMADIDISPGQNVIIPCSRDNLNRIVTPFKHPKVQTVSDATIKVDGTSVYVAPGQDGPVTMFIQDGEREAGALSVTLAPQAMPPREITLKLVGSAAYAMGQGASPDEADAWERSAEYPEMIRKTLTMCALGEVPQGYGLRKADRKDPVITCSMSGLTIQPRQALDGNRLLVLIALLQNTSGSTLQFEESSCYGPSVLAVSAWPKIHLDPGEQTELYVVFRRPTAKEQRPGRPSLLGQGEPIRRPQ